MEDGAENQVEFQHSNICTILYTGEVLGVVSFDEESCTIYADTIHGYCDNIEEVISSIKTLCRPTLFLVHPKMSENSAFLELLSSSIDGLTPNEYVYKIQKSVSWNVDMAIDQICSKLIIRRSPVPATGAGAGQEAQQTQHGNGHHHHHGQIDSNKQLNYLRQSAFIDLQNVCLCQTIGALLSYLAVHVFPLDNGVIAVCLIVCLLDFVLACFWS